MLQKNALNVNMKVKYAGSKKNVYSKKKELKLEEFIFSMLIKSLFVNFAFKEDINNVINFIIALTIIHIKD